MSSWEMMFHSKWQKNMKNYFKRLKTKLVKELSQLYQIKVPVPYSRWFFWHWYRFNPKRRVFKWRPYCFIQLSGSHKGWTKDVNFASWSLWNHIHSTNLWAFHQLATFDQLLSWRQATFGHEEEGCLIDSSVTVTKWLLLSSLIYKSFRLLEKTLSFLICWAERFPWKA